MSLKKILIIISLGLNILSLFIFKLGATSGFSRKADFLGDIYFYLYIIVAITIFFITIYIIKNNVKKIAIVLVLIINVIFSIFIITQTNTKGWIEDIVFEDNIQITSDSKYRYDIELINWFQSNRSIRLHINNIETDENIYIPLDIIVDENEMGYSGAYAAWSRLIATDNENIYLLETTKEFENTFKVEIKKFEIDLINRISKVVK